MMPSYSNPLKANGFINMSVHGDAKRKESGSFDGDVVSEFGIKCLQIDDAYLPDTTRHDQVGNFRLDQSTKHTHTSLHTYAKTDQTIHSLD